MVDFAKLRDQRKQPEPTDPLAIFQRLPKPQNINDLWDGQSKALSAWNDRRKQNDLVIKLNTGGGKTLVGLLIGQSLLNELHEPVLYLCPNNQLVEQTVEKAAEVGISAVQYGGALDADFVNAKALLVGPYHALFNGLSRFGVIGTGREPVKVGAIICDDAHAALGVVRDAFTISIRKVEKSQENQNGEDLYSEVAARFRGDFDAIARLGSFDDIVERGDHGVLEVPYSAWRAKSNEVRELIAREHADAYKFQLPLLRDYFDFCHCLISARDVSITPFQPLVHLFPSFAECKRRIFMSATIADDSSIIRTFDTDPKSVQGPIIPTSLAGVGERMILAPSLMSLKDEPIAAVKAIVKNVAAKFAGAVVLVQSETHAKKQWSDVATVAIGNDVAGAVKQLRTGTSKGPFVFPNRYDGLDLAGDACRLLVLDGLPGMMVTYDLFRAETLRGNSSINVSLAQRIEQGLGRGTRGAGDYCVVILVGKDLTSWISRSASLALMTPSTRAQVQMGNEISKSITSTNELYKTALQCLTRNKEWVRYHAETLADRTEKPLVDNQAIEVARRERLFLKLAIGRDFDAAIRMLTDLTEQNANMDRHTRGWLLQMAGRAAALAGKNDLSDQLQRSAYDANSLLVPPVAQPAYQPLVEIGDQIANVLQEVTKFALRKGILDDFEATVAYLTPAATSNQFEDALKRFGELLGFKAQRPEHEFRIGPDVLWLTGNEYGFVVECKHRKDAKNPLVKDEHGQLLTSIGWTQREYPKRKFSGFIVHPTTAATAPAAADNTNVLTQAKLGDLVATTRQFYLELCGSTAQGQALEKLSANLLDKYGLSATKLPQKFLDLFRTVKK